MIKFLAALAVFGIITFCVIIYLKGRAEAKHCGFISDDYIENNEEDNEDDKHQN